MIDKNSKESDEMRRFDNILTTEHALGGIMA